MRGQSRKKAAKKRIPAAVPIAVLALIGVLLFLPFWAKEAEEVYDFALSKEAIVLTIEDGVCGESDLQALLTTGSVWDKWRAAGSLAKTPVIWKSEDPSVASVDEAGHVKAVEKGSTVITVSFGGKQLSCPVEVWYPLKGLSITPDSVTLQKAEKLSLRVAPVPEKAELPAVTFRSSDESILDVNGEGLIRARLPGTATVTAEGGGFAAECPVTVLSALKELELDTHAVTLNTGESYSLQLRYIPDDTTDDRAIAWSSADPSIAAVDENGRVQALAPGKTRISAQAGALTASAAVRVYAPLKGISFAEEEVRLIIEESCGLTLLYDPSNTTDNRHAEYSSSDPEAVTVDDDGVVKAVGAGEAMISAQVGEYEAQCHVIVRVPMTGIALEEGPRTLARGTQQVLSVQFYPEDTNDDRTVQWESSNPSVLSVSEDGTAAANHAGTAVISAVCGEFRAEETFTVTVPVTGITLDKSSLELLKGGSAALSATVLPEDTTEEKTVYFSSNNTNIATVDQNGNVTAVGAGSCTVTASHGSFSASCTVNVKAPMTGIALDKADITLVQWESAKLTVNYQPWDTTDDRTVRWTSSDAGIATVDGSGTVSGVSPGECTVTAQVGSFSASAHVRVNAYVPVESVGLSIWETTLTWYGQTVKIDAWVNPSGATRPWISWSSSNPSVASVSSDGTVTAAGRGNAVITATADGVSAYCQVTVSLPENQKIVVLDPGHGGGYNGACWDGRRECDLNLKTASM